MKKRNKNKICLILGIIFFIGALSMITENIYATIFYGILSFIFLFFARGFFIKSTENEDMQSIDENIEQINFDTNKNNTNNKDINKASNLPNKKYKNFKPISLYFLGGLEIPKNSKCLITLEKDTFNFSMNGINFTLNSSQLTDISIKTTKEIQKQYVSSAGGALAGGLMFGTLGALIGGRTKAKTTTNIDNFLIFTYIRNDNTINYLAFDANNMFKIDKIKKIIKYYKQNFTLQQIKLEL